jgi:lysophospholipase
MGEHGGRYDRFARELADAGIATYAPDLRGHGRSGGRRGHVLRFRELVDDLERTRQEALGRLPPGVPTFLLGHSLGGLVALRYLQELPGAGFRGAIFSAPLLGIAVRSPVWKRVAARILSGILPWVPFASANEPADLSSDPAANEAFRADPLIHSWVTPRMYTEVGKALRTVRRRPLPSGLPLLFLIPDTDRVVRADHALAFARSLLGGARVEELRGTRHEPLNDRDRDRVVGIIREWIVAFSG